MSGIADGEGEGEGALPEGWAWARLGDIVDVLDSQRQPVSAGERAQRVGDVPYYGAAGQVGWIDQPIFNEELILLGEDGIQFFDHNKRKSYVISGPAWVNNHAHVLRTHNSTVLTRFLNQYLNHHNYDGFANGTTRLKLTKTAMLSIPVPLPPLSEQHRIVEALEGHLSRLDKSEALLKASEIRLRSLSSSLLQSTLDGARHVVHERLVNLVREPFRNGHSAKATSSPAGIRTLNLTSVTNNDFSNANTKLTSADPKRVSDLWLEPGDILIQRSNTPDLVGTSALFSGPPNWAIFPDLLIRVRTDSNLLPEFAALALSSKSVRQYFKENAKGLAGSMPKIDQATISNVLLPVPPIQEQKTIVSKAHEQAEAIKYLTQQISRGRARARGLRTSLLHHAFTGRLVPQDPADEPASALLARIKEERAAQEKVRPKRARRASAKRAAPAPRSDPAEPPPATSSAPLPTHAVQQAFDVFQDQDQDDPQTQDAAQ